MVRCWGYNVFGQLGSVTNNGTANPNSTPQPAVNLGAGRTAVAVTAGNSHSCALLDDGTVRCWADNFYGQLADFYERTGDESAARKVRIAKHDDELVHLRQVKRDGVWSSRC